MKQQFIANLAYHWNHFVEDMATLTGQNHFEIILLRKGDANANTSWLLRPLPELREASSFREALLAHPLFPLDFENLIKHSFVTSELLENFTRYQDDLSGLIGDIFQEIDHRPSWLESLRDRVVLQEEHEAELLENAENVLDYIGYRLPDSPKKGCPAQEHMHAPNIEDFFRAIPKYFTLVVRQHLTQAALEQLKSSANENATTIVETTHSDVAETTPAFVVEDEVSQPSMDLASSAQSEVTESNEEDSSTAVDDLVDGEVLLGALLETLLAMGDLNSNSTSSTPEIGRELTPEEIQFLTDSLGELE